MIVLHNSKDGTVYSFATYEGLYSYIRQLERDKFEKGGQITWGFIERPHSAMSLLHSRTIRALNIFFTPKEQEAYEKGLSILEIYKGEEKSCTQIVVSSDVNVKELRETWCQDYCVKHGYTLHEKQDT